MNNLLSTPDFFIKPENWANWRNSYGHKEVVIDNIEFHNIDFSDLDFSNVKFTNCHFEACVLKKVNLISADLSHSSFAGCDFSQAKLIATNLANAKFTACNLKQVNLLTAVLEATSFIDCDLTSLDLQSFDLSGISLDFCNLTGQNLVGKNLSNSSLKKANLTAANLTDANFSGANLDSCILEKSILSRVQFRAANLSNVSFFGMDLSALNFTSAKLNNCDFRYANLSAACFNQADISGIKLFNAKLDNWDVRDVICQYVFWDDSVSVKADYKPKQFEKIYSKPLVIELKYDHRLMANEILTLPILIEHLQAMHWGTRMRLLSIEEVIGGALVKIVIDDGGNYAIDKLEKSLNKEASRLQKAQLSIRNDFNIQKQLKEAIGSFKETFWPRLLELAVEHEMEQEKNFCVLFIDLQGFSQWDESIVSERLSLFRGLLKPILERWHASHLNMEGDSLRATFRRAKAAAECALMIRQVLKAADFKLRIGIDLGKISVVHNEVTNRSDLEGAAVSMASRIESIAKVNEILVSEKVKCYVQKETDEYLFRAKKGQLIKAIAGKQAGDWINIYVLEKKNDPN